MTIATTQVRSRAHVQPKFHSAEDEQRSAPTTPAVRIAVLTISRMPKKLRPEVESLMAFYVTSESELSIPGADPLTASWCTSWSRDRTVTDYFAVGCRELLTGSVAELEEFSRALADLADDHEFFAELRLVD